MKLVLLSADSAPSVYSVPDIVAENLSEYCIEFCGKWLHTSEHAQKYRAHGVVCYNEIDFVEYLNKWVFPNEHTTLAETLDGVNNASELPEKYRNLEWFNF
ncbi:MAG: hypothetical protein LBU36_03230 [Clostridiales bacterium]|nr:hypothetical protein [Clostridiales bacterium]